MRTINRLQLRHARIRKRVMGTTQRPRLAVHFSGKHIYAQVIDDITGRTLASASTVETEMRGGPKSHANVTMAEKVGSLLAERSKERKVSTVVFDRGGFTYHGKVKALAEAARAAGLEF